MAIAIKSLTTALTVSNPVTVVTSESPSATQVGDLVVVIHGNDYYALSNMPTPTATGSPTITAVSGGSADAGTDQAHVKSYTYVANTGGAQTISVTETGSADEEKFLAAYVLSGADTSTPIDVAGGTADAGAVDPWPIASISPSSSDAFLIGHANPGGGSNAGGAGTPPAGMTERYDTTGGLSFLVLGATQQLSASGATGTKTFDPVSNGTWAGVLIAVRTAAAGGGAADTSRVSQVFWMPRRRGPHPFLSAPLTYWPEVVAALSVDQTDDAGLTDAVLLDRGLVYTDSAGLVDAVLLARSVEFTDSTGLTDTVALTVSQVVTDSAGLTDTSLVQSGKVVTQTDSAGLVDAAVLDRALVYTDSTGLTDTAALARSLEYTDSAGLTDTSSVLATKLVTATDDAGLTDGTLSLQFVWLKTDSVGLTDTSTVTVTGAAVYTDSAGLADAASVQQAKEFTDSTGLTDVATAQAAKFTTVTDSAGLTDGSVSLAFVWLVTDSAGLTDSTVITGAGAATVTQTDSAGLVDAAALTRSLVYTDSSGLTDTSTIQAVKLIVTTDDAGLTDSGLIVDVEETFTDSAGLTDVRELALSKLQTDSAGLTDTSSVQAGRFINPTDSTGLTDSATSSQAKGITDDAGLTDTQAFAVSKSLTDSAGLTDSALAVGGRDITITDSAGLTDTRIIIKGLEPTDSVGLTDTQVFAAAYRYTDSAGLTDTSSVVHLIPVVFGRGASSNGNASTGGAGRGTVASGKAQLALTGSGRPGRG